MDAQIKSLDWGSTFVGDGPIFGVVIGVEGCGRQAVYQVVYGTGWVLNSEAARASR